MVSVIKLVHFFGEIYMKKSFKSLFAVLASAVLCASFSASAFAAPPAQDDPRFKAVVATEEMKSKSVPITGDKLFETFAGKSFATVAKIKYAPRPDGNRLVFTFGTEKSFFGDYKGGIINVDTGESWQGTWFVSSNSICMSLSGLNKFCNLYNILDGEIYKTRKFDSDLFFEFFTPYSE